MPLALDCLLLSKDAVLSTELNVLTNDVLPVSTCPRTPTLRFRIRSGGMDLICSGERVGSSDVMVVSDEDGVDSVAGVWGAVC
mmetsp:Transcript_16187/g.35054  ORF Transcript_16187/g.35054 Transcript_16187/m.35054 type:complete len:83 (+) Transcript_16187:194-442(+)